LTSIISPGEKLYRKTIKISIAIYGSTGGSPLYMGVLPENKKSDHGFAGPKVLHLSALIWYNIILKRKQKK
jgi:hypothetical protein